MLYWKIGLKIAQVTQSNTGVTKSKYLAVLQNFTRLVF